MNKHIRKWLHPGIIAGICIIVIGVSLLQRPAFLPSSPNTTDYSKAKIVTLGKIETKQVGTQKSLLQKITVQILDGADKNKSVSIERNQLSNQQGQNTYSPGETVIMAKTVQGKNTIYAIADRYRLPSIGIIVAVFFLIAVGIAGKKGFGAIIGMMLSLFIILSFIVPNILHGSDPLLISIIGAFFIMITSIFLAHGLSDKTAVAVVATGTSLVITAFLSILAVQIGKLSGLGSEEAYTLQMGAATVNLKGLLLGGMIIGSLGVLDDVTTTQTATIFELAKTDTKLSVSELFKKGFAIGKEHIVSVVNTLILAYAGASLGLFILFVINPLQQPYWVILNNEMVAEEIVRSIAGSIGIILAVPITTLLASFFSRYAVSIK
ncbi:MAG: YibE/F family protein [Candidatus Levybacteria bacterium]|nr:YibE/F family protein [Candidatus Levybacteria bacterium]